MDTDVLRGAIGQVQQDVFIFTGDIKSNISLRNEEISLEGCKTRCSCSQCRYLYRKNARGYDSPVTERGSTLSAGQRQLLSFARTLAYDPAILVLDEATANIDTETEALITNALQTDGRKNHNYGCPSAFHNSTRRSYYCNASGAYTRVWFSSGAFTTEWVI